VNVETDVVGATSWQGFEPYVGPNYPAVGDAERRLWVLGESHYGKPEYQTTGFTQDVVRSHVFWQPWQRKAEKFRRSPFFGRMSALALDRASASQVSEAESHALWSRIAFSNFVPMLVGLDRTHRPTDEMWAAGRRRFLELIEVLKPHAIVACGFGVWNQLPKPFEQRTIRSPDNGTSWDERRYVLSSGQLARVVAVAHPAARGWRYSDWRPRVRSVMSLPND
jgi:hypothetical protein